MFVQEEKIAQKKKNWKKKSFFWFWIEIWFRIQSAQ